jgi:hypothetical protein
MCPGRSINQLRTRHKARARAAVLSRHPPNGRVRPLRRPVSLTRDAKPNAVRDWVDELRRTVRAFEANDGRIADDRAP